MSKPCGCRIEGEDYYYQNLLSGDKAVEPWIVFCPLHKAAPALYQALNDLCIFFDSSNHISVFAAQINAGSEWVKAARRAVASAQNQEPVDDSEMPLGPIKAPTRGLES